MSAWRSERGVNEWLLDDKEYKYEDDGQNWWYSRDQKQLKVCWSKQGCYGWRMSRSVKK